MSLTLVQALQRQRHARLIETHISWVLLDASYALKIKKPVRLSFLDFSTLAERQRLCVLELTLNRRLAPELYLDVLPITGTAQTPQLGGEGPAIEYALRMKRFPDGALLSEHLAAGTLTPAHLGSLAGRLAAFHQTSPSAPVGADWGSPQRITQALDALVEGLSAHGQEAACARLRPWLAAQADQLHGTWLRRQAAGQVVEGHGDLHLANVVVLGEAVTAFDCIEFDPALRWVDGLSDIAFLMMDLLAHGRPDLAWHFLNTYLDERGDHAGVPVLRYYLVYRALVRALVAQLRADQGVAPGGPDYLALAQALAAPPARPLLLITHGVSGAGKTHVARQLAERLGAVHLRSDVVRKRLFGLSPAAKSTRHLVGGIYDQEATRATYGQLRALAQASLQSGWPVIVDATFLRAADRASFRALASQLGLPWRIVHCHAPTEVLQARILARQAQGEDPSEADLAVLAAQQASHEALLPEELAHSFTVGEGGEAAFEGWLAACRAAMAGEADGTL